MTRAGGFSLWELTLALSLAAVLAGLSVLSHEALRPSLELTRAARQVLLDLRLARMRALSGHVNYRIVFTDDGCSYQPQRKSGRRYEDDGASVSLPLGIVVADCSASDRAIGFGPRGSAVSFGTVTIRNTKGEARRVVVDITGDVRVQ